MRWSHVRSDASPRKRGNAVIAAANVSCNRSSTSIEGPTMRVSSRASASACVRNTVSMAVRSPRRHASISATSLGDGGGVFRSSASDKVTNPLVARSRAVDEDKIASQRNGQCQAHMLAQTSNVYDGLAVDLELVLVQCDIRPADDPDRDDFGPGESRAGLEARVGCEQRGVAP